MKNATKTLTLFSFLLVSFPFLNVTAQGFSKINRYKYVVMPKYTSSNATDVKCMEIVGENIKNWLIEHDVPVVSNTNEAISKGALPCEIIPLKYFYTRGGNNSHFTGNITAKDCDFNSVVSLTNNKVPMAGGCKYYSNMFNPILEENDGYVYRYSPPEIQKQTLPLTNSNPVATQPIAVQNNTVNTNQVNVEQPKVATDAPVVSDVDLNIPVCVKPNSNRFALIIGNEDYHSSQNSLRVEANVEFAAHDAAIFKEYAIKVLGVPEENLIFITNAKLLDMNRSIDQLSLLSKATAGDGEIFFYYAGHGFPDEKTKEAYIIPVDVSGSDLKYAIKLKDIYTNLTAYQSKRVTIFLDACFSGGAREEPLLANRGIKIKPKETVLSGNEVVFCATSNDQSAMAYKAKGHGIFTYFLLKKLQETRGDIAYGELYESIQKQVAVRSILENRQEQSPTVIVSPMVGDTWKDWRMK